MYSISFCIYSCLFPIFVHVYRPLPPGGISTAVNKYHNLPVAVMPLPLSIYCRFITSFIATFCVKMLHHFYLKYFSFILPPHPRILYTAVVHEDGQVGRNTLQNTIISEKYTFLLRLKVQFFTLDVSSPLMFKTEEILRNVFRNMVDGETRERGTAQG